MNRCFCALTLCLGLVTFGNNAVAQSAKDLVGTWTPVSVEAYGPNPKGLLIFDANGRFSIILMRPDLPKFASNKRDAGTAEENKAIVGGSLAYYGTYSLSGNELTLRTEGCTFPNWTGMDQKRTNVSITGDELKYSNNAPSAGGGTAHLVWRRAK
jgi:Lipocalin-like domain